MKYILNIITLLSLLNHVGMANDKIPNQLLLKSNLLNLPFGLPSLTAEYQIAKRQSISATVYKGQINLISLDKWFGAHVDYRYYFKSKKNIESLLKNFYVQAGYNIHVENNYLQVYLHGLRTDFGYQYQSTKSRFVFETGAGLFSFFEQKVSGVGLTTNFRLNASVGLRLY